MNAPKLTASLRKMFSPVQCLLLDVDGVLTDGALYIGEGVELKAFSIYDGHGIVMGRRAGLKIGLVSGRPSKATEARAAGLGIEMVYFTTGSKLAIVRQVEKNLGVKPQNLCYVGDDVIDLPVLRHVGAPVAVANAVAEVKARAKYVTQRRGGDGAVREVIELILKSQNVWQQVLGGDIND